MPARAGMLRRRGLPSALRLHISLSQRLFYVSSIVEMVVSAPGTIDWYRMHVIVSNLVGKRRLVVCNRRR